jgi:hypothetical protein
MIFENLNFPHELIYCKFYLKKNGKFNYSPLFKYKDLWCLLKDKINYFAINNKELFNIKNNDKIINILLILLYIKKKYTKYKYLIKNDTIYIINNIDKYKLIKLMYNVHEKNNDINYLFAHHRNYYSKEIKNSTILTRIFYTYYITKQKLKKLKINLNNIENYHELYLILKKKKVVDYYYNVLAPNMIKYYKIITDNCSKKILNKKYNYNFKDFKKIDILKIINKYAQNKSDKKYIKDNFIKLAKKYNLQ